MSHYWSFLLIFLLFCLHLAVTEDTLRLLLRNKVRQEENPPTYLLNHYGRHRLKRQTTTYFRGRLHRGQTQSQYLSFGSGNHQQADGGNTGKAEAESSLNGSRAFVSGINGMGQAQSQSDIGTGCEDCYNRFGLPYFPSASGYPQQAGEQFPSQLLQTHTRPQPPPITNIQQPQFMQTPQQPETLPQPHRIPYVEMQFIQPTTAQPHLQFRPEMAPIPAQPPISGPEQPQMPRPLPTSQQPHIPISLAPPSVPQVGQQQPHIPISLAPPSVPLVGQQQPHIPISLAPSSVPQVGQQQPHIPISLAPPSVPQVGQQQPHIPISLAPPSVPLVGQQQPQIPMSLVPLVGQQQPQMPMPLVPPSVPLVGQQQPYIPMPLAPPSVSQVGQQQPQIPMSLPPSSIPLTVQQQPQLQPIRPSSTLDVPGGFGQFYDGSRHQQTGQWPTAPVSQYYMPQPVVGTGADKITAETSISVHRQPQSMITGGAQVPFYQPLGHGQMPPSAPTSYGTSPGLLPPTPVMTPAQVVGPVLTAPGQTPINISDGGIGGGRLFPDGCPPVTNCSVVGSNDSHHQAVASVQRGPNGTEVSATAAGGSAQSHVSGISSGAGAFNAQAGTVNNGGRHAANTQVSGDRNGGALAAAQGQGAPGAQSQAQLQHHADSGATMAHAHSSGLNHHANTQMQASETNGGTAGAQANGPGHTAAQAQIAFQQQNRNTASGSGGTASAQGDIYTGQAQSQIQGIFRKYGGGVSYNGAAQAASGQQISTTWNQTNINPLPVLIPFEQPKNLTQLPQYSPFVNNSRQAEQSQQHFKTDEKHEYDEYADNEYDDYNDHDADDDNDNGTTDDDKKRNRIRQATKSEKQHILWSNPLQKLDSQTRGDSALRDSMDPSRYQIRPGYWGHSDVGGENKNKNGITQKQHILWDGSLGNIDLQTRGDLTGRNGQISPEYQGFDADGRKDKKENRISQAFKSQKQHILLDGPLEELDVRVLQTHGDPALTDGMTLQPGQRIPGTPGYQIPPGYRGRVSVAYATNADAYAAGDEAQAQSVTITPGGTGRIYYVTPRHQTVPNSFYKSATDSQQHPRQFFSVAQSQSGASYLNGRDGRTRILPQVYYTQSSTCGFFTDGQLRFPVPNCPHRINTKT